jgi:dihydroxyacetone kinase-like predicted kinase
MKKKIFLIFILFSFFSLNAQKYVFNTLAKYSSKFDNNNGEVISYSNSKNDSYFLRLIKNQNSFTAKLYDYKNLKVHEYTVIESKSKNDIFFKFNYENTTELYYFNKNDHKKYVFTFQTINVNDSIRNVKFNVYKNSKKKKSLMEYELEIKKSNENLFPTFRISCIHPYEFLERLNIFENGVVINAKGKTLSGNQIEFKLEELKVTNFELDIPKQ